MLRAGCAVLCTVVLWPVTFLANQPLHLAAGISCASWIYVFVRFCVFCIVVIVGSRFVIKRHRSAYLLQH